ncbi:MAG: 4Fe-4S dicluster domain-containing protein [Anaerolineae bacterium]|nr:4Fe-4S dicluster domain-containing protein [Anaerolineae bacterium]
MNAGVQQRINRILNPRDGRAVCVAADHGWMSDFTPNVAELERIVGQVVAGGADAILMSYGQAQRLGHLLAGRDTPALLVRADWMNMPRLGASNVANAVPQQELRHLPISHAADALRVGASGITIYLFLGYSDDLEASNLEECAAFAQECRRIGLVCIIEPLAVGANVTGANIVDILTLGARMVVEAGADMLKIPYTGDVATMRRLVEVAGVPVLVLGGARSKRDRDGLDLVAEAFEAGAAGTVFGRNVTKAPDPAQMVRNLCALAHGGASVDDVLAPEPVDVIRLKGLAEKCTGCRLCEIACSAYHGHGGNPLYAVVRVHAPETFSVKRRYQYTPMHCTLCGKCVEACPEGALVIADGVVRWDSAKCQGHGACVEACPLGVVAWQPAGNGAGVPLFCDLCGGDPQCAAQCPEEAIVILERSSNPVGG